MFTYILFKVSKNIKKIDCEGFEMGEFPKGIIKGERINEVFSDSMEYHLRIFYDRLKKYDSKYLYKNWLILVRSIDELINIPFGLENDNEKDMFLSLEFDFNSIVNMEKIKDIIIIIEKRFDKCVAQRFKDFSLMCFAINQSYVIGDLYKSFNHSLKTTQEAINYFQSRRTYYVSLLNIIPKIACGKEKIKFMDTLNFFKYPLDTCLVNITTSYFNLLLNSCLDDFEIYSNGIIAENNSDYKSLESFYFEPNRLSLQDQVQYKNYNFSEEIYVNKKNVFNYNETYSTLNVYRNAFDKYSIKEDSLFIQLEGFLSEISSYVVDDYEIVVEKGIFNEMLLKYNKLELYLDSEDFYLNISGYYPFQFSNETFFSTVPLIIRFISQSIMQRLDRKKSYQINSGFIFEDMVKNVLKSKGYESTGIKRINHKEFDLITIKNNKVYNFQCKNNSIKIAKVFDDYKKISRQNRRLCKYYEKALQKEIDRENLIKLRTGIDEIEHFVISRFPVITNNARIINFNMLEEWDFLNLK